MASQVSVIQAVSDTSELVELFKSQDLYLKPIARIHISVTLPQLKDAGRLGASQAVSNWDLMERIKKLVSPLRFATLRVSKNTMEFVRFEAETDNREQMTKAIKTLDNATLKVIGFYETLKVRAAEAKTDFPSRHDWDAFFRDARNMDEMRPGERPDTLYLAQLPLRWMIEERPGRGAPPAERSGEIPSEALLRRVFETFGEVRCVDVPVCDPYRKQMSRTGMRSVGFSFGGEVTFEAYVQFVEYISFVKAMDTLRGMKLVHFDADGAAHAANIKVDFDRTKHLSDKNIRRRRLERERLVQLEKQRKAEEEAEQARIAKELAAVEKVKSERRTKREEKRRIKQLARKQQEEERSIEKKILREERKLVVAERKLESMRLLTELIKRVEMKKKCEEVKEIEAELEDAVIKEQKQKEKLDEEETVRRKKLLKKREKALRTKVSKSAKEADERRRDRRRDDYRRIQSTPDLYTLEQRGRSQVRNRSYTPEQAYRDDGYYGHSDYPPPYQQRAREYQAYPQRYARRANARSGRISSGGRAYDYPSIRTDYKRSYSPERQSREDRYRPPPLPKNYSQAGYLEYKDINPALKNVITLPPTDCVEREAGEVILPPLKPRRSAADYNNDLAPPPPVKRVPFKRSDESGNSFIPASNEDPPVKKISLKAGGRPVAKNPIRVPPSSSQSTAEDPFNLDLNSYMRMRNISKV